LFILLILKHPSVSVLEAPQRLVCILNLCSLPTLYHDLALHATLPPITDHAKGE
jgi:hypothetical protein